MEHLCLVASLHCVRRWIHIGFPSLGKHLISVRFNGKLAISGRNLCHSLAFMWPAWNIFRKDFWTFAWNVRCIAGCSDGCWGHIWSSVTLRNGDELFATGGKICCWHAVHIVHCAVHNSGTVQCIREHSHSATRTSSIVQIARNGDELFATDSADLGDMLLTHCALMHWRCRPVQHYKKNFALYHHSARLYCEDLVLTMTGLRYRFK